MIANLSWRQVVALNFGWSEIQSVPQGVPQRFVLGPLLFIVIMNNLVTHTVMNSYLQIIYADDTNVCIKIQQIRKLSFKRAAVMNNFTITVVPMGSLWISVNPISWSLFITISMIYSHSKINQKSVDQNKTMKFWGVILDHKMT